jgi:hypothetical protein
LPATKARGGRGLVLTLLVLALIGGGAYALYYYGVWDDLVARL